MSVFSLLESKKFIKNGSAVDEFVAEVDYGGGRVAFEEEIDGQK